MGPAKWFLVFAKNVVIDAIECVAHIQINNIAVSFLLSTTSSIGPETIREVSVACHFFPALFHHQSFVCV